jgi:hypothetical protein
VDLALGFCATPLLLLPSSAVRSLALCLGVGGSSDCCRGIDLLRDATVDFALPASALVPVLGNPPDDDVMSAAVAGRLVLLLTGAVRSVPVSWTALIGDTDPPRAGLPPFDDDGDILVAELRPVPLPPKNF